MRKPSTEQDYRRRIARVVEAILVEPGAPHTLESLAAVAHLSPYHFQRIYRALAGESVIETALTLDNLLPETKASRSRSGASYRDPRIKAVFAIAPALGEAFDQRSFADVTIPVSLLAGDADVTAPVNTNIHRIAGLMPKATVTMVPGASHYTFPDTCMPDVVDRLAMICKDNAGVGRDAIHAHTAERARDFFAATLPANHP